MTESNLEPGQCARLEPSGKLTIDILRFMKMYRLDTSNLNSVSIYFNGQHIDDLLVFNTIAGVNDGVD